MKKYVVLEKKVGETPLECVEEWRRAQPAALANTPLSYAGRLDPMASGKLLVLIGDECKVQEKYHALDKEYVFEVLFGAYSDTADVLGMVKSAKAPIITTSALRDIARSLTGEVTLPYPHFSSKTVKGKPLHVWTLEGRLDEIQIPTKTSTIHKLQLTKLATYPVAEVYETALTNINSIKTVTDPRKALGQDFRRVDVRAAWNTLLAEDPHRELQIATFRCIASSGTYMRTLATEIGKACDTQALAFSITRTTIGRYQPVPFLSGFWWRKLR